MDWWVILLIISWVIAGFIAAKILFNIFCYYQMTLNDAIALFVIFMMGWVGLLISLIIIKDDVVIYKRRKR